MTRVLSGAALLVFAAAVVWFAPASLFLLIAEVLLLLGVSEYSALVRTNGGTVPTGLVGGIAALTCAAFSRAVFGSLPWVSLEAVLMAGVLLVGVATLMTWTGETDALSAASASIFPALYLGLPIGAMVAIRETHGREALALLMLTVIISDTAQYYTGRTLGRRLLAPKISPKKTIEGAIGGFVFAPLGLAIIANWWLPSLSLSLRLTLGVAIVAFGIWGDLFESMLKRSADVKDSSALIPGHGGVLDRVDALLFAAPVYYLVLAYA